MRRLAVILARGGSKRIPDKNIKNFCGTPMVVHTIRNAEKAGIFDKIHVSTDSPKIAETAAKFGHAPDFQRPAELADDYTPMMKSLQYVVSEYKRRGHIYNTIALLYATSPLMKPEDLHDACKLFESERKKPVLSVVSYPVPIEHAFRMNEDHDLSPVNEDALAMRTQDLEHAYYDAAMFSIFSPDHILQSEGQSDFSGFKGYKVEAARVTDIDWPEDWDRAEAIYKSVC